MEPTADYNHSGDPSGCPSSGMTPSAFLTALWGDPPPGVINIWRLPDRISSWHRELGGINNFLKAARPRGGLHRGQPGGPAEGTLHNREPHRGASGGRRHRRRLGGHRRSSTRCTPRPSRLPPDREEARAVMAQLPYEPTLIVDSGHGPPVLVAA